MSPVSSVELCVALELAEAGIWVEEVIIGPQNPAHHPNPQPQNQVCSLPGPAHEPQPTDQASRNRNPHTSQLAEPQTQPSAQGAARRVFIIFKGPGGDFSKMLEQIYPQSVRKFPQPVRKFPQPCANSKTSRGPPHRTAFALAVSQMGHYVAGVDSGPQDFS